MNGKGENRMKFPTYEDKDGTNLAEVGTDCISRQAAIDALKRKQDDGKGDLSRFYNTIIQHDIEAIMQLPPAQPKTGRWIKLDMHRGMADHKCSVCEQECYVPTCMGEPMYAYCPNCGAKMEVTE